MRILFAGGGTGGHLFPGLALAQRLLAARRFPPRFASRPGGPAAFFLCTSRPFDTQQLSSAGFPHAPLPAPRLGERGFVRRMTDAVRAAATCLRVFHPDVVMGLGGYGSAPTILAALSHGVPVALMEQNVIPGRANRAAARAARRIYGQWAGTRRHFGGAGSRFRFTGSPLRAGLDPMPPGEAKRALGLDPGLPAVAVIGGSQGADSLNRLVLGEVTGLNGASRDLQFLHIAGPASAAVEEGYRKAGIRAVVRPFVREMERVYSAADLAVSRAGAMAIAELARFAVPAVLVPYPHAAEDHQTANARTLADAGAAWLVDERRSGPGALAPVLKGLVSGDGELDNRRRRIARFARPDAGDAILGDLATWV